MLHRRIWLSRFALALLCSVLLGAQSARADRTMTLSFVFDLYATGGGEITIVCKDDSGGFPGTIGQVSMAVAEGNINIASAVAAIVPALPGYVGGSAIASFPNVVAFKVNDMTDCACLESKEVGNFIIRKSKSGPYTGPDPKLHVRTSRPKVVVADQDLAWHPFTYKARNTSGTVLPAGVAIHWTCTDNAEVDKTNQATPAALQPDQKSAPIANKIRFRTGTTTAGRQDRGRCFVDPNDPALLDPNSEPVTIEDNGPVVPALGFHGRAAAIATLSLLGGLAIRRRSRAALLVPIALLLVGVPGRPVSADPLTYKSALSIELGGLPIVDASTVGVGNASGGLGSFDFTMATLTPSGPALLTVTNPSSAVLATNPGLTGTFALFGTTSLAISTTSGTIVAPGFPVGSGFQPGSVAFALAAPTASAPTLFGDIAVGGPTSTRVFSWGSHSISVMGGPWAMQATITTPGFSTSRAVGFKDHGVVQFVAPIQITSAGAPLGGGFARMRVELVPEPRLLALLFSSSVLLAWLGWRRARRP